MAKCKSCGAEIIWATTQMGKAMPMDSKPEWKFILVPPGMCEMVATYVSHFATCPNADTHRRTDDKKEGESK